jgi:double-strand break repair protein MRE11
LKFKGRKFHIEKIPLKTVRPFLMEEVSLSNYPSLRPTDGQAVQTFLAKKIDDLIQKAQMSHWQTSQNVSSSLTEKAPLLPLIRLKVKLTYPPMSYLWKVL